MDEKIPKNKGIKMFAVNESQTQIAIVPYTEERIYIYNSDGNIIAYESLMAEQDSELVRYYETRKKIQVNEWIYYSTSQNKILDFLGLHYKIVKKNTEGIEGGVYGNSDSKVWIIW